MSEIKRLSQELALFAANGALADQKRREQSANVLSRFEALSEVDEDISAVFRRLVAGANISKREGLIFLAAINVELDSERSRANRVRAALSRAGESLHGINHPNISKTVSSVSDKLVRVVQAERPSGELRLRSQTRSLRVEAKVTRPRRPPTPVYEYRTVAATSESLTEWSMSPFWQGQARPTWEHSGDGEFGPPDFDSKNPQVRVSFLPPVESATFLLVTRFPESEDDRSHGSLRYRLIGQVETLHFQVKFPCRPEYVAYIECNHLGDWPRRPDHLKEIPLKPQAGESVLADFSTTPTPHREVGLLWVWNHLTFSNGVLNSS